MQQQSKEIKGVKAGCEECGAEVLITYLYSPAFRDPSPLCPFCQFPLTRVGDSEELVKQLAQVTGQLVRRAA